MLGQGQNLNNVRFLLSYLTDKFHLRVRMFGGFVVSEKNAELFCFVTAGRKKIRNYLWSRFASSIGRNGLLLFCCLLSPKGERQ